jgi:hypothetical protein
MRRYMLLMYDTGGVEDPGGWDSYLEGLRESGRFEGGSSIGATAAHRKNADPTPQGAPLVGYLIVHADTIEAARSFLENNPVFEAGGTVEICELVED